MPLSYSALMPPSVFIAASLLGVILAWGRRRLGLTIATLSAALLYLAATPLAAALLLAAASGLTAETPAAQPAPQAIVVLGGDIRHGAAGIPDAVGPLTLERLLEGARAQRTTRLPILVSGGSLDGSRPLAEAMAELLERDFGIAVRWREDRSQNTFENASLSARMLRADGIASIVLVTHPWHMARAAWSFRRAGIAVLPWPTPDPRPLPLRWGALLPQSSAVLDSFYGLHEIIGLAWYRLAYRERASEVTGPAI